MKTTTSPPFARRLRRGQVLRFERPRQLCLRSERGSLWVTVDGRPEDIELDAGASRVFDGQATVLVSALGGDALLSATPLASGRQWRPWLQRLRSRLGLGHNLAAVQA